MAFDRLSGYYRIDEIYEHGVEHEAGVYLLAIIP